MRIGILTPTYDGKVYPGYRDGVLQAAAWCWRNGHELLSIVLPGCSLMDKARNLLLDSARSLDLDEYVFIDADVGFDGNAFERLLSHDVAFVGGVYPLKKDVEEYPVDLVTDGEVRGDLLEAKYLPTGFMRVRRDAVDKLVERYGDTNRCLYRMPNGEKREVLHLFEMGRAYHANEAVPSYVGEDVHFCNIYRLMGEKCWLDPHIRLTHTGEKTWSGDYAAYRQRVEAQKAEEQGA